MKKHIVIIILVILIPCFISANNDKEGINDVDSESNEEINDTLIKAANKGDSQQIKKIISSGGDINFQNEDGFTVLMLASRDTNVELVRFALSKKANPNIVNFANMSAIFYAILGSGKLTDKNLIVKMLISHNANVSIKNTFGVTCLKLARQRGYTKIVKMLKDAGAIDL